MLLAVTSASPGTLLVIAGTTAGIYLFLIAALRLGGRRQLAQLSGLHLVVVLLLGSAVETAMIHGDLSLAAGLVSAATLLVLNRLLTLVFLRIPRLSLLVNGVQIPLVHDRTVLEDHLRPSGLPYDSLRDAP